jgi:hypothetical protein
MRRPSPLLARLLVVVLLGLWAVGPAHCLFRAAAGSIAGTAICHGVPGDPASDTGGDTGGDRGVPHGIDGACPLCNALAGAALVPASVEPPAPIVWAAAAPALAAAPPALSSVHRHAAQPRAPPASA